MSITVTERSDIEQVRQRIDIRAVISRYLTLAKAGASYKGRCPFHKDDTPSFVVNPEKGLWHCFGCGEGGDVFGFLMKMEKLTFPEALERLAAEAGVSLRKRTSGEGEAMYAAMAAAAERFQELLRNSSQGKRARDALTSRGLDAEMWPRFGLGYAAPSWDDIKHHLAPRFGVPALLKLGLLSQSENRDYDRFRDRIMFPIFDLSSRPIAFGGRAFDGSPKYLNSPATPLFDKGRVLYGLSWARDALQERRCAVLVEGYTDVLSLHVAGIAHAVGSMGTALTQAQADLLGRFADEVIIAYDRDAAGGAAALRGMVVLRNSGLQVRVALLPEGTDPDSLVRSHGAEGLNETLHAAVPFHKHFASALRERFDLRTTLGKEQALDEARAFFPNLTSITLRNELVEELHASLGLTSDALLRDLTRQRRSPSRRSSDAGSPRTDPGEAAQTLLLSLVLRDLVPWSTLRERLPRDAVAERFRSIVSALDAGEGAPSPDLASRLPDLSEEDLQLVSNLTLRELPFAADNPQLVKRAVRDALIILVERPSINAAIRALDTQIVIAEQDGDRQQADELQRKRRELVAKRRSLGREPRKGVEDAEAQRPGNAGADGRDQGRAP